MPQLAPPLHISTMICDINKLKEEELLQHQVLPPSTFGDIHTRRICLVSNLTSLKLSFIVIFSSPPNPTDIPYFINMHYSSKKSSISSKFKHDQIWLQTSSLIAHLVGHYNPITFNIKIYNA